ncbi:MAG TPA: site-2 protease family protein [Opitutus sp.]|nr:site-2 protease family protein [Opitutus sp.]
MNEFEPAPSAPSPEKPPSRAAGWLKKLGPVGVALLFVGKLLAKLKFVVLPLAKYGLPLLKTGGTMLLSIWVYALTWGWWFALGFVLLIFVHECGHLVVARKFGLKVGAPVFIPFMGALIALKEAPRNAWIEACVGIGGPVMGSVGAAGCVGLYLATGEPLFRALAYTGFFLNLFNLAPVGFLDGGRIATALSPWMWLAGFAILVAMVFSRPNFLLILILVMSLPRIWSLFRPKTDEEKRYFEVTRGQRITMATMYFGLVVLLVIGMHETHLAPAS